MALSITYVHSTHSPWTNLSDIRDKILPKGQSAPNEPHGYDMMSQTYNVLVEPSGRRDRSSGLPLGLRGNHHEAQETLKLGVRSTPRGWDWAMALGDPGQPDLLGGVGVGQGDGKHTRILLCSKVPVEVGQPGQSCDTRTAIRGAQVTAADWHQHPVLHFQKLEQLPTSQGQVTYGS